MNKEKMEAFYNKHYKTLMIIPIIIFAIAVGFLFFKYYSTGEFIAKDVGLSGGVTATVATDKEVDIDQLEALLSDKLGGNVNVRRLEEFGTGRQVGIIVEAGKITENLDSGSAKLTQKLKN